VDNPNRWKQRFQNFEKAYAQFNRALAIEEPSEFEKMALVKAFEFTHELCWNTMKDYLEEEGFTDLKGSKDTFRAAFKAEIIQEGEVWMESIDMRVASVHTYNHEVMDETVDFIRDKFAPLLNDWYHIFKDKEREQ
jgi:nucleotidyltransferase substrate binding protein (TIGR01987 family)